MRWAQGLRHPLRPSDGALPASLQGVQQWVRSRSPGTVRRCRREALDRIRVLARGPHVRQGKGINVSLFRALLLESAYSDVGAAECCAGASISGELGGPAEWPDFPLSREEQDPLPEADALREHCAGRAGFLASVRPTEHDRALWASSVEDAAAGKLSGPLWSLDEVVEQVGPDFFVSRRFPVVQGDKVRPCDDFLRSLVNRMAWCRKKLKLPSVDSFCQLASSWFAAGRSPTFWKVDHRAAYRQIPLREEDRKKAVVVFRDPVSSRLCFWIHNALPFGALGAVYGYNRAARALVHIARTLLHIPVDSYYDDFWGVEDGLTAQSSFEAFKELNVLLGFDLKEEKEQAPSTTGEILGLEADISAPQIKVQISAKRKSKLSRMINGILAEGRLLPGTARKFAGKLQFACSGVFGKVGRAALQPFYVQSGARRSWVVEVYSGGARLLYPSARGPSPLHCAAHSGCPPPACVVYGWQRGGVLGGGVVREGGCPAGGFLPHPGRSVRPLASPKAANRSHRAHCGRCGLRNFCCGATGAGRHFVCRQPHG